MALDADPYRTLGLPHGASLAEVKRAYRALAKANHPDAAGEAALPRFLAIQAAYEQIAGPGAASGGATRGARASRRAWDAEADRAEATRRAYGGRPRRARPAADRPPGAPGQAGGARSRPGPDGQPRPSGPERPPNKATFGSTSYDGADAEPFEPDWGGASWYGTTSGTYWTLNPKEYADPRKHGPEYQARARRRAEASAAARAAGASASATAGEAAGAAVAADPAEPEATLGGSEAAGRPAADVPPSHSTASWWEATAGHAAEPEASSTRPAGPASSTRPTQTWGSGPPSGDPDAPSPTEPLVRTLRAWVDDDHPGFVGRVARAVLGWAPLALAIGWLAGEMSGCARFAATCDPGVSPIAALAQLAVLGILLLVPVVARIALIATIATLAAAIPGTLVLTATAGPGAVEAGRAALAWILVIAWVVGLGMAVVRIVRELRGVRDESSPSAGRAGRAGPVS